MTLILFAVIAVCILFLAVTWTFYATVRYFPKIAARMTPDQRLEFNRRVREASA